MGKMYERLIKERFDVAVDDAGLNERQFGVRKRRSTIKAINTVVEIIRKSKTKQHAVIALDIKNAFNSASWGCIIQELRKRNIPQYLRHLVESYVSYRTIKINKNS